MTLVLFHRNSSISVTLLHVDVNNALGLLVNILNICEFKATNTKSVRFTFKNRRIKCIYIFWLTLSAKLYDENSGKKNDNHSKRELIQCVKPYLSNTYQTEDNVNLIIS
jgi:hypothetical protein